MIDLNQTLRPKLNSSAVKKALLDPETFATVLQAICLIQYGDECYTLPSTELYLRLKDDFGVWPCEEAENKIQAIMLATSTEEFYEDPDFFRSVVHTLIGGDPQLDTLEDMTLSEIYWAIYEVELNHGEEELSDAIKRLISREVMDEAEEYTGLDELRPNYVLRAVGDYRRQLIEQFKAVGINRPDLPTV